MSAYSAVILADAPVAYYRLGELSGTTAFDSTANAYNGALSGTGITLGQPGSTKGDPNNAMLFDGVAGKITLPLVSNHVANMSFECWVSLPNASGHGVVLNVGYASGFGIGIGGTTWDNAGANIVGCAYGSAFFPTGVALSFSLWHHIVMTFGTLPGNVLFYLDGGLIATLSDGGYITPVTSSSIGADLQQGGRYFHGSIDEVAVYTAQLTAAKVRAHYNQALALGITSLPTTTRRLGTLKTTTRRNGILQTTTRRGFPL